MVEVAELPGGPVIDTPKNHQRRELLVPAFVVKAIRRYLVSAPDGLEVFVFPGRQKHTAGRQQSYSGFAGASAGLSPPWGWRTSRRTTCGPRTRAGWPTRTA